MSWLLLAACYALFLAVYGLGHELGRKKGRREGWAVAKIFHAGDVARTLKRSQERRARLALVHAAEGRRPSGALDSSRIQGIAPEAAGSTGPRRLTSTARRREEGKNEQ